MKLKRLYRWQGVTVILLATGVFTMGCQSVPTIEKSELNPVIQEEFTQTAVALTNELNDYELIDELFIENESDNALSAQVIKFIKESPEAKKNKLRVDTLDLKLFTTDTGCAYFLALLVNNNDNPYTMFGKLSKTANGNYVVSGEHIGAYAVNMPKTFLLEKDDTWVVVSQQPFSTFEECFFFKMENDEMKLFQRGWEDMSLLYYSTVTELLEMEKIDEAMAVEDTSMYPMGYEQELFEMANLMIEVAEKQALVKEQANDYKKALSYLDWGLNYYFMNHYGSDLDTMVKDAFEPLLQAADGEFGSAYLMDRIELKAVLLHYANLLGKAGREKDAELYRRAIERAFN